MIKYISVSIYFIVLFESHIDGNNVKPFNLYEFIYDTYMYIYIYIYIYKSWIFWCVHGKEKRLFICMKTKVIEKFSLKTCIMFCFGKQDERISWSFLFYYLEFFSCIEKNRFLRRHYTFNVIKNWFFFIQFSFIFGL